MGAGAPGMPMVHRFTLDEADGRDVELADLAYDPVRNELWSMAWVREPHFDAVPVHTTATGVVLRVEDLPERVRGVALEGPLMWVATSDLAEYAPPPPGAPWPPALARVPASIGLRLAFEPFFVHPDTGEPGCASWTVDFGWPNHLDACEAACAPLVVPRADMTFPSGRDAGPGL